MRLFWNLYLRLTGWSVKGTFPHTKKCVVIVGPHTSNWDFILGLALRSQLHLHHFRFLGKKELFDGPFGFVFKKLGGVPVDRSASHNMVDQVVDLFNSEDTFALVVSPEGTRKKVERLRTGFYHIAKKAAVPIIMVAFDFGRKEAFFSAPFFTGEDEAADLQSILRFYAPVQGKVPEQGMAHLLKNNLI